MRPDRWKSAVRGFAAGALFGALIFQLIRTLLIELLNSQNRLATKIQIELGGVFIFASACFGLLYGFIRPDECVDSNVRITYRPDGEPLMNGLTFTEEIQRQRNIQP
ncbi:MAG TPA: hypothetical protein VJK30_01605 [Coxiellaceae bacterium]|nr:MAG: hypothetical protein A3E81_04340 [Gammaproteobacteria bacterium RIFCSPHIGHO2_12_FULL_36_30]HLB56014.1 hypothetical protein [Coxiellaceae bacterium]